MNKQIYKTAPLPFQGQKRNFIPEFKDALTEFISENEVDTIVDLFGGSGLLSHTAKRMYPSLRCIYNDFDDFHLRLQNVDITNSILRSIRTLLVNMPKEQKLDLGVSKKILELIKEKESKGLFIDYITLSSSLMFSGKYATDYKSLSSSSLYNNVKKSDYITDGYLDGLEVVKCDYRQLFNEHSNDKNVLFVIDPPYLSTDVTTYSSAKYWKLKDYLDVLKLLTDNHYVFFTSDKSCLIELCDWFSINYQLKNPFSDAKMRSFRAKVSRNGGYLDLMYYKNYKR